MYCQFAIFLKLFNCYENTLDMCIFRIQGFKVHSFSKIPATAGIFFILLFVLHDTVLGKVLLDNCTKSFTI